MLRLDKDLLQTVLVLVEFVIDLVQIVEQDSVRDHLQRIQLSILDLLHEMLPVLVHWGLTVTNKANTALHQRPDVEVICLWLGICY